MSEIKSVFRSGMRRLAASVCVISTLVDGKRYAMTASSVTSVSDSPASLLVCVNQDATMQSLLKRGQPFVINVLSHSQSDISNLCASGDYGEERFAIGDWCVSDEGMPYLKGAQVNFFCRVDNDNYLYGTHQIVIGRLDRALLDDGPIVPLVYLDGNYCSAV